MSLYSLIVLRFAKTGHRRYRPPRLPWYRHKPHASFADMLATMRTAGVRQEVFATGLHGHGSRKAIKAILHACQQAA